MSAITSAMPDPRLTGLKDASTRAELVEPLAVPQHFPLFYIHAERGPMTPHAVGAGMATLYGPGSFDQRSKFYSHATLGLTTAIGAGNLCMVRRVVPTDATEGGLVFTLEVVEDTLTAYARNADGSVILDASGIKTLTTATHMGYRMRWGVKAVTDINNIRGELAVTGTMVGAAGQTSTIYPIFAFKGGYGDYINNVGVKFSFPGPATSQPADMSIMDDQQAALYRVEWMERSNALSTPRTHPTITKADFVDFCLKAGAVNTKTGEDLGSVRIKSAYEHMSNDGSAPIYGPMNEMHIYEDNLASITGLIQTQEVIHNPEVTSPDYINIMNVLDSVGHDLYSARIDGGVAMNESTTHYALGGSDGTVNETELAAQVTEQCLYHWEDVDAPLVDRARYPISVVYDTGFPIETSKAILGLMAFRKDISVAVCTQDVLQAKNTVSAETSILTTLRATARLVPESVIYGTPTTRAVIVGHAGDVLYNKYPRAMPLIIDLIEKRARYMGAGDGKFKNAFAYDVAPANQITSMINVTNPWKPRAVRASDWDMGLNTVRYVDMNTLFWPALQTVYDNDTSVLNSDIVMLMAVDVIKKSEEVWRQLTGNGTMLPDAFLDKCNALMSNLTDGKYDDRITVRPNAYYTAADEARGYSWTMDTEIFANNMPTVGTLNVSVRRSSDL